MVTTTIITSLFVSILSLPIEALDACIESTANVSTDAGFVAWAVSKGLHPQDVGCATFNESCHYNASYACNDPPEESTAASILKSLITAGITTVTVFILSKSFHWLRKPMLESVEPPFSIHALGLGGAPGGIAA